MDQFLFTTKSEQTFLNRLVVLFQFLERFLSSALNFYIPRRKFFEENCKMNFFWKTSFWLSSFANDKLSVAWSGNQIEKFNENTRVSLFVHRIFHSWVNLAACSRKLQDVEFGKAEGTKSKSLFVVQRTGQSSRSPNDVVRKLQSNRPHQICPGLHKVTPRPRDNQEIQF